MGFDGASGDVDAFGDLGVAQTVDDEFDRVVFSVGELCPSRGEGVGWAIYRSTVAEQHARTVGDWRSRGERFRVLTHIMILT